MRDFVFLFLAVVVIIDPLYGQELDKPLLRMRMYQSIPGDSASFRMWSENEFDREGKPTFYVLTNDSNNLDSFFVVYDRRGRYKGTRLKGQEELSQRDQWDLTVNGNPISGKKAGGSIVKEKTDRKGRPVKTVREEWNTRTTMLYEYDAAGCEIYRRTIRERINPRDTLEDFQRWWYYETGDSAVERIRVKDYCRKYVDSIYYNGRGEIQKKVHYDLNSYPAVRSIADSLVTEFHSTGKIDFHFKEFHRNGTTIKKMVLSYQCKFDIRDSLLTRYDYTHYTRYNEFRDKYEHRETVSRVEYIRNYLGMVTRKEHYSYRLYSNCTPESDILPDEIYFYDAKGRVIKKIESWRQLEWIYNEADQLTEERILIGGKRPAGIAHTNFISEADVTISKKLYEYY